MTEAEFRRKWEELSEQGACDSIDGAEYRRVFAEWEAAGRPANLDVFIPEHANAFPDLSDFFGGKGRPEMN